MLRKSLNSCAVAAAALMATACAGGGGGGGGGVVTPPPPPPPPPPPYASNCAATPGALSCETTSTPRDARMLVYRADGSSAPNPFEGMIITPQGLQSRDDIYTFSRYGAGYVEKHYTDFVAGADGLGRIRTAANVNFDPSGQTGPGDGSKLTLFEIANVLQGGLDYVQLGRISPGAAGGLSLFFATGQPLNAGTIPTTGSARFDGGTRGTFISGAGAAYDTSSDITMTADFGAGQVSGSTSNFKMIASNGVVTAPPHSLNFDFSGNIVSTVIIGTATNSRMTGDVTGMFHGERNGPPVEASIIYRLDETTGGGVLIGAGGLRKP